MATPTDVLPDREFWKDVLTSGGLAQVPRWSLSSEGGTASRLVPAALVAGISALAESLSVPADSVLLAAHAKVLCALTGEREVVIGYSPACGAEEPLPCKVAVPDGTWRQLVQNVRWSEVDVLGHSGYPSAATRAELGLPEPPFETVLDLNGSAGMPGVLTATFESCVDGLLIRVTHRTEVLDSAYAERIIGYHLRALALMTESPDDAHEQRSLLDEAELNYQFEALAGPSRSLPNARFHELFEERVRRHPDAVAAVHAGRSWTYRELNGRANRIGRALLARGLRREDVVAVVTERNLDWMASVLAIFKAGGGYLPIEPHFPADRVTRTLARAEARFVLTEHGSSRSLEGDFLLLESLYAERHSEENLGVVVEPGQLAYIYFTSGSTGEPKGAMCEHAGMLNHLYAKIDDFGIGEGQVVAQTAPQCFDISLWQLVSALLVGGRTLIVEQEAITDVPRFLDTIAEGRVQVAQLVPSYLEVVLSHLEQEPRELPDLHCVSATGEALKKELAARWFERFPDVRLANAYGLTETSDDTNHEVMDRVPETDRVPLGRAVNNVSVYVVDENLMPVPLGAPGEIVFSGVCVGRGYINDPERTRAAFLTDPHRPGQRLYRSGDFGRWLPSGKLEFLGRRDAQVKIRGFRVEIGEIENRLLLAPEVRDGAVVIVERADGSKHLIGFYTGAVSGVDGVRAHLAAALPEYMVPSELHQLDVLPLTSNGKIDKKALVALAATVEPVSSGSATDPRTPTEERLAAAWAEILKRPVGRDDHFFELGGTSLSAVRLAMKLKRAVALPDIAKYPVLSQLAAFIDGEPVTTSVGTQGFQVRIEPGKPAIAEVSATSLERWATTHRAEVRTAVAEYGAVLVRGLGLTAAAQVEQVARLLTDDLVTEREGFARRTRYAEDVYSSSEWAAEDPMCMHHELSYLARPPALMLFGCLRAPSRGGATAVADAAEVLAALPTSVVERFERLGWMLERTYNADTGVPLVDAFGTDDPAAIERYCAANGIDFEWLADGKLHTRQTRSAVSTHPESGQRCWFNQIAFLSEWTLDPMIREYLVDVYGPQGLPFTTHYGDGTPIEPETVATINSVYESLTRREPWRAGDLLIVDNLRSAHSREPYQGSREVVVVMAEHLPLALPSTLSGV